MQTPRDTFLENLPRDLQKALLRSARPRHLPAETVIFRDAEQATAFYGLQRGEVRIRKIRADGAETILTRLSAPYWFGEMSFIDGAPRMHDAVTSSAVDLLEVPERALRELMSRHRALHDALVQQVCRHTRALYGVVDDLMLISPERMLARRMIELAQNSQVHASQEELAALVGVSRQSINRILGQWQARGYVRRAYRRLDVLREADLRALWQAGPRGEVPLGKEYLPMANPR
ncbi:Crp/Fnr family transcriptional regulator [Thalassococcus sp. S3]|uniref:Crp/Fnr family transcriptional regulator n=1 Tax=Thalassococcus sp. S3 TaxID=2017482 RepID=UPI0010247BA6|nr:Crp/Fnr family transcriptional regulator [Thalassococcus sp. S3]QBF31272.1 hypothetical protein CFI11_08585 [Thalassococcus sp. S3]